MRNPIRIEGARAAHAIHYSLGRACASRRLWLLLLLVLALAGCSNESEGLTASDATPVSKDAAAVPDESGDASARAAAAADGPQTPVILFLGTSLTAGYGLEEDQAFPALIQQRLDRDSYDYRVVNAGVSGDTSAGGLRRLDWLLRLPIAVLVLELGANDMLRGQGIAPLRKNLAAILDRTRAAHPDVKLVIAGMRAAPNLGPDYAEAFDAVYPALASQYDAVLVPFLLEDVAARRNLNQADGIHPTAEGHALIAERVWSALEPVLR